MAVSDKIYTRKQSHIKLVNSCDSDIKNNPHFEGYNNKHKEYNVIRGLDNKFFNFSKIGYNTIEDIYNSKEDSDMNPDEFLSKYIESLDKKYDDFKRDMIESERRIREEKAESEKRQEKLVSDIRVLIEKNNDKMDQRIEKIENKIDGTTKWVNGLVITTIVGIISLTVTVVSIVAKIAHVF